MEFGLGRRSGAHENLRQAVWQETCGWPSEHSVPT